MSKVSQIQLCHGIPRNLVTFNEFDQSHLVKDERLGNIWAIVLAEMLTYRRLEQGDQWNSENCDMKALLHYLKTGDDSGIGLVANGLISAERCPCGRFDGDASECLTMERASSQYFANLEDWKRITVIQMPERGRCG